MIEEKTHFWTYVGIAAISFVLGWQATSYGFLGELGIGALVDDTGTVSLADTSEDVDMDLFWLVWRLMEDKYVDADAVVEQDKIYGAVKGLVDAYGDPYSSFMTPKETEDFNASLEGTLEGIGAELTKEGVDLVVVTPLKNSPAEKAGLKAGDIILKVEDEFAAEMTMFEAIMKIRGEKGSTVNLTILRKGVEDPIELSIVRDSIDIESVTTEKLDGDIMYISVNQFNDKTNDQFGKVISELILDEPKGLVIDLRYNGGGYLDIAIELLSYIFPSGTEAVIIRERGKEDAVKLTNGNPKLLETPVVVLVNEGSASASEILAGAVQDHERGIIMGTTSFGKGTVQEVEQFGDGSSMRLTIAKWFTPEGTNVNKVGLTPDIIVEMTDEDADNKYDRQKEEAAKYLRNL